MRNSTLKFCAMLLAICTSTIHLQAMDEWDGVTIAKGFYSGTGTKANPYRIFTASQFLYFIQQIKDGNTFSGKYIELCNDIAFNHDKAVNGYGDFYGDFDGNDHSILMDRDGQENYSWQFCRLYGSIHDVQFVDACNLMNIYTGGILYNCRFEFNGYHGSYTVYLQGGTIANCVSNSAYFHNRYEQGGAQGFVGGSYESNGYCSNCYFPIESYSYGNTLASNYRGVIESCGEEAGNDWVLSHTERAYKSWPLTFNPTYPDYNVTITFVDEYGFVSYDAKTYLANSTIGELPIPDVDNTFLGWKYNGTYVQSTDVITHDMVLYADWKHEIKVQPTIYEASVICNDKEHATYQWYYQERIPIIFEDITYSKSTQTKNIVVPDDDLVLSFDFYADGYIYTGYRDGDDIPAWIRINGELIVSTYEDKESTYSCQVSAGTYEISCERSDITNIRISCPTDTLANEISSVLPKQTIMNRPGAYFCKVTYSNNGDELISDYVNYEKLLTIDNVTYVVNEDSTATVLWVADEAVNITILETVYHDDVHYPVTSISSKAFVNCTSLASIRCKTLGVPVLLGGTAFEEGTTGDFIPSNATLFVLIGHESAYAAAEGWKDFGEIFGMEMEVELIDGQTFDNNKNKVVDNIAYTRTFNNTNWQALYVPFDIPVTEEFLDDFEVADLNNVHQYDYDNDNIIDETVIEAFKMTSGTLEANYPYLIRAKETGEKNITMTDATLYAAEENSIDCSSVREKFTFTGTYSNLSSTELPQGEGYYTLIEGEWQPVNETVALGAFRFYLKVDSRHGDTALLARNIRLRIVGDEENEDDATGIENSTDNGQRTTIYDLTGRKVLNTDNLKGVYIVNGKKVVLF